MTGDQTPADLDGTEVSRLMFRNILLGAEPGGGKSILLNLLAADAALYPSCQLRPTSAETTADEVGAR